MRFNINKTMLIGLSCLTLFSASPLLQSCKDEDEALKSVDLRYKVEESYLVEAKSPEAISFKVKSTDPWEVFGKYDWYTLSPDKGEAGETYTVTLTCKENTNLDDRIDTINIKSDYWTGKRFTVTQKGIAFLQVEGTDFVLSKENDQKAFQIVSNQKWTAEVTSGNDWLSIASGESGEINGEIAVKSTVNTGEQRTGKVTIYDRHGVARQVVACVQNGVMLSPAIPENEKWFVSYETEQVLEIAVEANSEWTASKDNEEDDWFTITQTSFNGSAKLQINLSEHKGSQVRTGVVVLASKAAEGVTPVVKKVKFKQANPQTPVVKEVNQTITGSYSTPGSQLPGLYKFYFDPMTTKEFKMFCLWGENELRYHILDGITTLSTRPWCADVFDERGDCRKSVDLTKPNVLSFDIAESIDAQGNSWIYTDWILNGISIVANISDGITNSGFDDSWKVPWSVATKGGTFSISVAGGSAILKKYEYIAPLVWGD